MHFLCSCQVCRSIGGKYMYKLPGGLLLTYNWRHKLHRFLKLNSISEVWWIIFRRIMLSFLACPAGSFSSSLASSCSYCGVGQYGPSGAQSGCFKCGVGYYSSTTGSSSACTACSEGSFSQRTGMIACNDCAAGSCIKLLLLLFWK